MNMGLDQIWNFMEEYCALNGGENRFVFKSNWAIFTVKSAWHNPAWSSEWHTLCFHPVAAPESPRPPPSFNIKIWKQKSKHHAVTRTKATGLATIFLFTFCRKIIVLPGGQKSGRTFFFFAPPSSCPVSNNRKAFLSRHSALQWPSTLPFALHT